MPNIQFKRLRTTDVLYIAAENLLDTAFPPDERRPADMQRNVCESVPFFSMNAILCDGTWAGLLSTWNFGKIAYIEHFAVEPPLRDNGIGKDTILKLISLTRQPIVLEVEPEGSNHDADRRINFYKNMGFKVWETPYTQPPYAKGRKRLPMRLMAYGIDETSENVEKIKQLLLTHVYKQS